MCLEITNNPKQNEKDLQRFINNREEIYGYKTLRKLPEENFYRSLCHSYFIWNANYRKIFQNPRSSRPTEKELKLERIRKGFHVYTELERAKSMKGYNPKNRAVAKFRVKAQDIVAIENNWPNKELNFNELVCRRLEFVGIIED
jgi:hypothetical protein